MKTITTHEPPTTPAPIDEFLDRLLAAGYEVDPAAPVLWLYILSEVEGHHPTKPGQWIAAYGVREAAKEERTETNGSLEVSA